MSTWVDEQAIGYVVEAPSYRGGVIIRKPNTGFAYKTPEAAMRNAGHDRKKDPRVKLLRVRLEYEEVPWPDQSMLLMEVLQDGSSD